MTKLFRCTCIAVCSAFSYGVANAQEDYSSMSKAELYEKCYNMHDYLRTSCLNAANQILEKRNSQANVISKNNDSTPKTSFIRLLCPTTYTNGQSDNQEYSYNEAANTLNGQQSGTVKAVPDSGFHNRFVRLTITASEISLQYLNANSIPTYSMAINKITGVLTAFNATGTIFGRGTCVLKERY